MYLMRKYTLVLINVLVSINCFDWTFILIVIDSDFVHVNRGSLTLEVFHSDACVLGIKLDILVRN